MILNDSPIQKALVTQLWSMRRHCVKVLRGPAVEPLHDLRVAALRVAFALKFFKKYLNAGGNTDRLRDEFARGRHIMAQRRDWDVFSSHIKKDFQLVNTPPFLKQKILQIIKAQKAQAHQDLVKMLRSRRYKKMLLDLKEISSTRNKRKVKPRNLLKGLLERLGHKPAALRPSHLHKIRITFKHLRYACEFLAVFYDQRKIQKVLRNIVKVQDLLGEYHDAENTVRMLRRLKITPKPRGLSRLIKIEKDHAHHARKQFEVVWRAGQCRRILSALVV